MRRVLFVCGMNRMRSPSAEQLFANWPGIDVTSAGLDDDADVPLSPELIEWAEIVFVMETSQRIRLSRKFRRHLRKCRVVTLDIPDRFEYMDPELVVLLMARVPPHLGTLPGAPGDRWIACNHGARAMSDWKPISEAQLAARVAQGRLQ